MKLNSVKKLVIIGPGSKLTDSVFLSKLESIINNSKISTEFWGWNRYSKDQQNPQSNNNNYIKTRILFNGGGEANKKLVLYYPIWMMKIFIASLLNGKKTIYFCNRFDTALPLAIASLFVKRDYIFANHDNISKSYKWPSFIKNVLLQMERFVAKRAKVHLIPGISRWEKIEHNIVVIPNTPESNTLEKANSIKLNKKYNRGEKFTIYVNGLLTRTRGISTIVDMLKINKNKNLEVLVAGKLNCDEAKQLITMDRVNYLGKVSNDEALALYYKSHLAITLYDPDIEINRLAEPNKWGDCIATSTPFLVNKEVITAEQYIKSNSCFNIPYSDAVTFSKLIDELINNKDSWENVYNNIKKHCWEPWDKRMENLLVQSIEDKEITFFYYDKKE